MPKAGNQISIGLLKVFQQKDYDFGALGDIAEEI